MSLKKGEKPPAEERRMLATPIGEMPYRLQNKQVKNINLRICPDGEIRVSAPRRMPVAEVEAFLLSRTAWIMENRQKMLARPAPQNPPPAEECLALFLGISDRVFPLFFDLLGGQKPCIQVKSMKSRWGVCHPQKRILVFSTRLALMPMEAIEYVVLHEYVHFLHPNHQAGFHAEMARLMPDYRRRRKLLRP